MTGKPLWEPSEIKAPTLIVVGEWDAGTPVTGAQAVFGHPRGKSDEDSALGYELMRRFIPVIVERLQATRVRMLDVYGHVATG